MLLPSLLLAAALPGADCNANGVDDSLDLAAGRISFAAAQAVEGDRLPPGITALEFTDLNEDGRLDIAAAGPSRVAVLFTDDQEALRESQSFILGSPPIAIAAADLDGDADLDLADAVHIATYLFLGGAPPGCLDAADAGDDARLDLTDAVRVLAFLFLAGPPPAAPGPPGGDCGPDPAGPGSLGCEAYSPCG